jgi:hypothetical protein
MGSFDELIEKKVVLDETDRNPEAILLHKDSAMKVTIVYFSPYDCQCVHVCVSLLEVP